MTRLFHAVALLCVVLAGSARAAENSVLELLVHSGKSPLRLYMQVEIDGKPLAAEWDEKFAALVSFFDRDGDRQLNEAESRRLPSVMALREVLSVGFTPPLAEPPAWKELDSNGDGKADSSEVAACYRRAGVGAPLIGAGVMPFSTALTNSLLGLLDLNGDKQVDEREWQLAPQALSKLDRNEDELVGAGELVSRAVYPGAAGSYLLTRSKPAESASTGPLASFPLILLPSDPADAQWAKIFVDARDRNVDGKLSAAEAGWDAAAMAQLDLDRDGALTPAEVAGCRKSGTETTCTLRLVASGQRPELTLNGKPVPQGALDIARPGQQVVVRTEEGKLRKSATYAREYFTEEFESADDNDDGVLAGEEFTQRKETIWSPVRESADRDGDCRLTRAELDAWLDLQARLAAGQALLTVLDGGNGLFELLDTNHDGALSLKELRSAATRVKEAGAMEEGKFDAKRLPALLLITASNGYPLSPLGAAERTGPAWFLAMDRNADGDVSPREFLGGQAEFKRLDRDGDGLLSATEAAAEAK